MSHETEHKLQVLTTVARHFNEAGSTWAVGASLLLFFKGKTDTFHDIDIMILEADVDVVKAIISDLGTIQPANPNSKYTTHHFIEATIDGVDLDIMAGFGIIKDGIEYDCSLKKEQIIEHIQIGGQEIPLQSLELWKHYYTLMDRENKVKMLKSV